MKKLYKLSLLENDKSRFDNRVCDFYVIAESESEAISKGEKAFAKGCLIEKTKTMKHFRPLITLCECEIEGVFIDERLL